MQLDLRGNEIGAEGAKLLAEALSVDGSITSIDILSNELDIGSADLLLKVKAEKPNLCTLCGLTHEETELDYRYSNLGPGDAKLLASEILVMPSPKFSKASTQ